MVCKTKAPMLRMPAATTAKLHRAKGSRHLTAAATWRMPVGSEANNVLF